MLQSTINCMLLTLIPVQSLINTIMFFGPYESSWQWNLNRQQSYTVYHILISRYSSHPYLWGQLILKITFIHHQNQKASISVQIVIEPVYIQFHEKRKEESVADVFNSRQRLVSMLWVTDNEWLTGVMVCSTKYYKKCCLTLHLLMFINVCTMQCF